MNGKEFNEHVQILYKNIILPLEKEDLEKFGGDFRDRFKSLLKERSEDSNVSSSDLDDLMKVWGDVKRVIQRNEDGPMNSEFVESFERKMIAEQVLDERDKEKIDNYKKEVQNILNGKDINSLKELKEKISSRLQGGLSGYIKENQFLRAGNDGFGVIDEGSTDEYVKIYAKELMKYDEYVLGIIDMTIDSIESTEIRHPTAGRVSSSIGPSVSAEPDAGVAEFSPNSRKSSFSGTDAHADHAEDAHHAELIADSSSPRSSVVSEEDQKSRAAVKSLEEVTAILKRQATHGGGSKGVRFTSASGDQNLYKKFKKLADRTNASTYYNLKALSEPLTFGKFEDLLTGRFAKVERHIDRKYLVDVKIEDQNIPLEPGNTTAPTRTLTYTRDDNLKDTITQKFETKADPITKDSIGTVVVTLEGPNPHVSPSDQAFLAMFQRSSGLRPLKAVKPIPPAKEVDIETLVKVVEGGILSGWKIKEMGLSEKDIARLSNPDPATGGDPKVAAHFNGLLKSSKDELQALIKTREEVIKLGSGDVDATRPLGSLDLFEQDRPDHDASTNITSRTKP